MKKLSNNVPPKYNWKKGLVEYGTATLIIGLVIWFVLSKTDLDKELKSEVKKTNSTVSKLEEQIDSVKLYQELLLQRTYELETNQSQTNKLIEQGNVLLNQNKLAIEKIRIQTNEKINRVSKYNRSQLDSFITDRYQK